MNVLRTFNLRPVSMAYSFPETFWIILLRSCSYPVKIRWSCKNRNYLWRLPYTKVFLVIIWKTVLELYTSNHTGSSFHVVYLLMTCPLHTVIILVNDTIAMVKVVFGFMVGLNHVFQSSSFHISKLSNSFVFAISWHKKKKYFKALLTQTLF